MKISRRQFLAAAGMTAVGGVMMGHAACVEDTPDRSGQDSMGVAIRTDTWQNIRSHFKLDKKVIHMAGLFLSSHPTPVRRAIMEYRRSLNKNPTRYVMENNSSLRSQVRQAAARYMGVQPNEIALTDSTTMGTALVITGLHIREDQEMLTAECDYYSTHESMRYQKARSGASMRVIPLYRQIRTVTEDEIVETLIGQVRPETRLITATWVHSATGLKIPVRRIAERLDKINAERKDADRAVFFVDGVHGLGVEDAVIADLGCDFFSAGTHKWMFGPRGTGILWGHPRAHHYISPTIPTFTPDSGWGGRMTPGGFKSFEYQWALAEAFKYHEQIGRRRVQERIHSLAGQLKEGLQSMDHVTLYTPMAKNLSSGIVCFDVNGMSPNDVVEALLRQKIVASTTPYSLSHARLTPGIYNTPEEMDAVLRAVRGIGQGLVK